MSYILEALKKAQAERQLGNAPTIHAPPPSYATPAARASRQPLVIGVAAGALVVALGAAFLLRQPAPAVQVASAPVPAPAPAAAQVPAAVSAPVAAPVAAPKAPAAAPVAAPAKPEAPAKPKAPPVSAKPAAPALRPAPRAEAAEVLPEPARPVLVGAAPSAEDNIGPLQSLPESVQREIPKLSFGGYIYSPNPAERLLLVDKMLRREGEEVAPGLVLERLLPKAAIMNYRGMRYRVAY
ncbi:MAG: general secretion pathway protein GspB [Janthinobacterium lividum]